MCNKHDCMLHQSESVGIVLDYLKTTVENVDVFYVEFRIPYAQSGLMMNGLQHGLTRAYNPG